MTDISKPGAARAAPDHQDMPGDPGRSWTGCRIGMLLLPGFNSFAAQGFLDPFRAANYLRGERIYSWEFLSPGGGTVRASSGLEIGATQAIAECPTHFEWLLVNASWTPEAFRDRDLQSWLRLASRQGASLGGVDTGAFVLAWAGLIERQRTVVHYEHQAAFNELFPGIPTDESLYVIDGRRFSCCGGVAAVDLALELIRRRDGIELANAAARYIFHERLRDSGEAQVPRVLQPVGYQVPAKLREAILLMERNIEEPLTQPELSRYLGLSVRQVQRIFRQYVGVTPVRYYLNLRLDRGRGLVTQTEMPIMEIAALCGFTRGEQFSRAYVKRYRITPMRDRIEGRIPFQFRDFSDHPGYRSV
jgi:AraC family carnitine catabolism transcriptional activator